MPVIPHPVLNNLKCVRCRNWLSCGPIRLLPNGGSICGRCHLHSGPKDQYRHFAFEALACYFKFPCKYWGNNCPEVLPFKKVLEHEKRCSYGSTCGLFCSHPSALFKAKRYLNVREAIKLEIVPDVVLEYLRCTNCAGYLSCAPVYVCRDGTSVCHRCNNDLQLDQQPNSEFIRDTSFETFVDIMIFPCIYRYRGCTDFYKFGEEMTEHEADCSYGKAYVRESPQMKEHDQPRHSDVPSNKIYPREEEVPRTPNSDISRNPKEQPPRKERGVIKTHSGHIYATITPNAPLFAPMAMKNGELPPEDFEKYRNNLANKWGQSAYEDYTLANGGYSNGQQGSGDVSHRSSLMQRSDNVYDNTMGNPSLIEELRITQMLRKTNHNKKENAIHQPPDAQLSNSYYNQQKETKDMGYNVYS